MRALARVWSHDRRRGRGAARRMGEDLATYEGGVRGAMGKQLLRHTMLTGRGGALVFLWSVGMAGFVLLLEAIGLALAWTVASAGILAGMMRTYARDRGCRESILRAVIEARFPATELPDGPFRAGFRRAVDIYAEIALKVADGERAYGPGADLRRVLGDGDGMLRLQMEASKQAVEFERALTLIDGAASGRPGEASRLHEESRAAVEKGAAEARSLALSILQGLEVLLLQVFQAEKSPADMVRTAELARETNENLRRLHEQSSARRAAAESVLRQLAPERDRDREAQ